MYRIGGGYFALFIAERATGTDLGGYRRPGTALRFGPAYRPVSGTR